MGVRNRRLMCAMLLSAGCGSLSMQVMRGRMAPTPGIASSRRGVVRPVCALGSGRLEEEEEQEGVNDVPPLEQHPRRKVALLVEPTPFTHVSGYSNRFKEMLRYLQAGGDEAEVITPDDSADRPSEFLGIPITYVPGFRFPLYKQVQLTLDLGWHAFGRLKASRPDLIHAVTPGIFVMPAIVYARLLRIPLVISYHTHLPAYAER